MDYNKGQDARIDNDFNTAEPYAKVKVGDEFIFWKTFLRWKYLPFASIKRAYRRVEEVNGRTGCCSNDFSVHTLIVITEDSQEIEIKIGEGLYRHEPERLIEAISRKHPSVIIGKE